MSMRALVKDHHGQRSLALEAEDHVLTLRHNPSKDELVRDSAPSKCQVEFLTKAGFDLEGYKPLRPGRVYGTLGLINIGVDIFLCLITEASDRAEIRPGEVVKRIEEVEFYGLTRDDFDNEIHRDPYLEDPDEALISGADYTVGDRREGIVHPCQALKKLLSDGSFYYSLTFDLTSSMQRRSATESKFDVGSLDKGYLWNSYMIESLIDFRSRLAAVERSALDASRMITTAIRGYVESYSVPASRSPIMALTSSKPSRLLLVSRLSCRRAGTRFNSRGIDDDGNVANFVETETVYWHPSGLTFSYTQIRGSVPIFWEQASGLVPAQQKIQITRSKEATQPSFDRHFDELENKHGSVHVLNLLAVAKASEDSLSQCYHDHIKTRRVQRQNDLLMATHYDFHSETSGAEGYLAANAIRDELHDRAESMAYFLADRVQHGQVVVVLQQQGVFRTNCLDCLDRTNLVQTILSEKALEIFLQHRGERVLSDFATTHGTLWANNGDALSKIYAGTGALKSSFTRHGKMSFAGFVADARKSVKRVIVNNFQDTARQNVIDTLLGRLVDQSPVYLYDPVNESIRAELERRAAEYSHSADITIWAGTFNLNGKTPGNSDSLSAWLRPRIKDNGLKPDIYVVSFQEIVELNPQQIMSTDPTQLRDWERAIGNKLNSRSQGDDPAYIQLRSGQLVGAALIIYVKASILSSIKNVEGTSKKTGINGIAGNKGAVAIRMDISGTRMCFVTSHLAAGQSNVEERNRDYNTIAKGLRFPRNRVIDDHDAIVWLGDFNYRIDGDNHSIRQLIKSGDFETLYHHDQLNKAMSTAAAFPFYSEGRIDFPPTYKYDNGTDDYDSSEKQRVPAWCDRILFKGKGLRQLSYNDAPLRFSDHRPVFAHFQCTIAVVNEDQKSSLLKELHRKRGKASSDHVSKRKDSISLLDDWDNVEAPQFVTDPEYLPTTQKKWWLRDGLAARSDVDTLGLTPNPDKTVWNPFTSSDEPDWVDVTSHSSSRSHAERPGQRTAQSSLPPKRKPAPVKPIKPAALSGSRGETELGLLGELADSLPSLPPRPGKGDGTKTFLRHKDNTSLLEKDEGENIGSIPSLVPSRPTKS